MTKVAFELVAIRNPMQAVHHVSSIKTLHAACTRKTPRSSNKFLPVEYKTRQYASRKHSREAQAARGYSTESSNNAMVSNGPDYPSQ